MKDTYYKGKITHVDKKSARILLWIPNANGDLNQAYVDVSLDDVPKEARFVGHMISYKFGANNRAASIEVARTRLLTRQSLKKLTKAVDSSLRELDPEV